MKKFILHTFGFIGFALILYSLGVILTGMYGPYFLKKNLNYKLGSGGFTYTRLKEADTTNYIDILFLGSSHCYRGYDPRVFKKSGLKIFALGTSAQTPLQSSILLKEYLNKVQPKLVVLDVYPVLFGSDGVESTLDLIANSKIRKDYIKILWESNNMKVYNAFIYGMFRQVMGFDKDFNESKKVGSDIYVGSGYVEKSINTYKAVKEIKVNTYKFSEKQIDAFAQMISLLKENGVPYIMVQAPTPRRAYIAHDNNREFDSLMRTYGRYINFNDSLDLSTAFFLDDSHLNQKGVEVYDKKLMAALGIIK